MTTPDFDQDKAHRFFAVECNNAMFPLLAKLERSEEETERMIQYAHAALLHWQLCSAHRIVNTIRGVNMLATVYAYAARSEEAMHYAEMNIELLEAHQDAAADFDRCYGAMAMARACACHGLRDEVIEWRAKCEKELESIEGAEDKRICQMDYSAGPWYNADTI